MRRWVSGSGELSLHGDEGGNGMRKMEMEEERMENKANMDWGRGIGAGAEGGRERGSTKTEVGTILMIFRPPRRPACQHPPHPTPRRRRRRRRRWEIFPTVEIIIAPLVLADYIVLLGSTVEWSVLGGRWSRVHSIVAMMLYRTIASLKNWGESYFGG